MSNTLHSVCVLVLCISLSQVATLEVGFYSYTCPNAESIVQSVVREATLTSPRTPALLLRLHFHDCFVEGCDGSILIDNGADLERFVAGHLGLGGFGAIEKAKLEIESQCSGVVSCTAIVSMAATDAIALTGGPVYEVETGRRDGRVSNLNLASDMPDVDDSIDTLISKFVAKGLSPQDLVLLSG
ncbi:peroxidase 43-like [Salvia hispanica]|uniref:peroxidase 43-like n=1 Tax=Salvia hispanica TaxID=49212 RepID=UPI0020093D63|nr:peroxidase 43-like [Salvia hispanica]